MATHHPYEGRHGGRSRGRSPFGYDASYDAGYYGESVRGRPAPRGPEYDRDYHGRGGRSRRDESLRRPEQGYHHGGWVAYPPVPYEPSTVETGMWGPLAFDPGRGRRPPYGGDYQREYDGGQRRDRGGYDRAYRGGARRRPPEESPSFGEGGDEQLRRWAQRQGYDAGYAIPPRRPDRQQESGPRHRGRGGR
jgi:hypothetical protein